MEWFMENMKWIFSGIGIFVIGLFINVLKRKKSKNISQKQKSGNNSINIQISGNVEVNKKND